MTVIVEGDNIGLTGRCLADDAEALLAALGDHPQATIDLHGVQKLHLAVVQILLVAGRPVTGVPDNPFLTRHVLGLVQ